MTETKTIEAPASIKELAITTAVSLGILFLILGLWMNVIESGGFWGMVLGLITIGLMGISSHASWKLLDSVIERYGPGPMLAGGLVFTFVFFSLSSASPEIETPARGLGALALMIALKSCWIIIKRITSRQKT